MRCNYCGRRLKPPARVIKLASYRLRRYPRVRILPRMVHYTYFHYRCFITKLKETMNLIGGGEKK